MTQQEQYWKELAESYLKIIKEINHQCGTANPSSFNQIKDAVASAIELSDEVINKESAPLAPAQGVEEADEYFYCKEWNNIGYMCEEQCDRCKKTENFTLDDPKVIKEAQSQALKYSEQYSEDRRISKKSSFIVGFIAGSRWQQGQQPTQTIGARWVKASERLPENNSTLLFVLKDNSIRFGSFLKKDHWGRENMFCDGAYHESKNVIKYQYVSLDESPCTLDVGWITGTPPLDKPCVFVSKSGSDYSVWEVINLNTEDGSYFDICDGKGQEWGDISDFRCDSYYMLSPNTIPTREQADNYIDENLHVFKESKSLTWNGNFRFAALDMYDWIIEQINKTKP